VHEAMTIIKEVAMVQGIIDSEPRMNPLRCLPALPVFLLFVWLYIWYLHPAIEARLNGWAGLSVFIAAFAGIFIYALALIVTLRKGKDE